MARHDAPKPLEIGGGTRARLAAFAGYLLGVALVGLAIVWLFHRFTGSLWLAVALVGFMLAYMAAVGWLTMRNIQGKR